MSKLLNYKEFISKNTSIVEHNSTQIINESVYKEKTLMEYVHSEMYNKLVKRILGGVNTDLNTTITPENGSTMFKAKVVFDPIWDKVEKYTNSNYTDFPASVLRDLQNEYRADKSILESISIPNVGSETYVMSSASENLKDSSNIVKLASEKKLVDLLKSKGIFDKLNDSQKEIFEKIDNKTEFIDSLKAKLYSKDFDSNLGISPEILTAYSETPGFKISKSSNSSFSKNEIGNYIIRDICLLTYKYYVNGLAEVISQHIIDEKTSTDNKKPDSDKTVSTTTTEPKVKAKVGKTRPRTASAPTTSFNPENLKNFGY